MLSNGHVDEVVRHHARDELGINIDELANPFQVPGWRAWGIFLPGKGGRGFPLPGWNSPCPRLLGLDPMWCTRSVRPNGSPAPDKHTRAGLFLPAGGARFGAVLHLGRRHPAAVCHFRGRPHHPPLLHCGGHYYRPVSCRGRGEQGGGGVPRFWVAGAAGSEGAPPEDCGEPCAVRAVSPKLARAPSKTHPVTGCCSGFWEPSWEARMRYGEPFASWSAERWPSVSGWAAGAGGGVPPRVWRGRGGGQAVRGRRTARSRSPDAHDRLGVRVGAPRSRTAGTACRNGSQHDYAGPVQCASHPLRPSSFPPRPQSCCSLLGTPWGQRAQHERARPGRRGLAAVRACAWRRLRGPPLALHLRPPAKLLAPGTHPSPRPLVHDRTGCLWLPLPLARPPAPWADRLARHGLSLAHFLKSHSFYHTLHAAPRYLASGRSAFAAIPGAHGLLKAIEHGTPRLPFVGTDGRGNWGAQGPLVESWRA